jgi:transposase
MLANQLLAMLADFGHVEFSTHAQLEKLTPGQARRSFHELPMLARAPFGAALSRIQALSKERKIVEEAIQEWHESNADSQRLDAIPGVGVLLATALCATVGNADAFHSSRDMAAWFQLVPRQYSSGEKTILGHIGHGNPYIRRLLYMAGAGVILRMYQRKEAPAFVVRLHKRGKPGKVIIFAIAHKIVRTAWRLLKDHVEFKETNDWRPVRYEEVRSPRSKRAALALTPESDSQARVNDKPVIGGELDLLADGKEAASKTGN